ncbi:MAG: hypothetical protein K0Q72_2007, partial [Armatimonadetes bacterium]|nr:hypothetical protein [Armatimonadota bacterium]
MPAVLRANRLEFFAKFAKASSQAFGALVLRVRPLALRVGALQFAAGA